MISSPYVMFVIFTFLTFIVTQKTFFCWLCDNTSTSFWVSVIQSLIVGCAAFISTGVLVKCR